MAYVARSVNRETGCAFRAKGHRAGGVAGANASSTFSETFFDDRM